LDLGFAVHLHQHRLPEDAHLALYWLGASLVTPELYFPCRNCGQWRRQHVGNERKCLFQASSFQPKFPSEFTTQEREATIDRAERLDRQLVEKVRQEADRLEQEIGKINEAARFGCTHVDEEGKNLLDRQVPAEISRHVHVICSLCGEDWYEDHDGKKL
jgi:hypothetical protein